MRSFRDRVAFLFLALFAGTPVAAQDKPKAELFVGERLPVLRIDAEGPTAQVTGLAFAPDGKTLYAAGLDKVVRVWKRNAADNAFELKSAYRVPLGPGVQGALNAMALSPDGQWLAAAGSGALSQTAGFREPGLVWVPSPDILNARQREDQGTIYVFNTHDGTVHPLRGHTGAVWSLAFAQQGKTPLLASVAGGRKDEKGYQTEARLWDLQTLKSVGVAPAKDLPSVPEPRRPGLAVWRTGAKAEQTRVALAFGDGAFRIWDVGGSRIRSAKDGALNITALHLPDRKRILTASMVTPQEGGPRGAFTLWQDQATAPSYESWGMHGKAPTLFVPYALAEIPSQPDLVAAVILVITSLGNKQEKREYRLCLLDTIRLAVVAECPLWSEGIYPVLATDPAGEYVAVAGKIDHSVHVYALDPLLKRRQLNPQVLRSVGASTYQVAWAKKSGQPGLLLRSTWTPIDADQSPSQREGDLIFELAKKPRLTEEYKDCQVLAAKPVAEADRQRWAQRHKVSVGSITASTMLPAGKVSKRPILAIGYLDKTEPGLGLYIADTGEQIRELTGHIARITSLAFSEDGKHLASASDDETVSVWDLTDIPDLLEKRGTIRGVIVTDEPDEGKASILKVVRVEPDSSAHEQLQQGDVIVGLEDKGPDGKPRHRAFDSARDFYLSLSERKPGEVVTLNLRGNKQTSLKLDQGIDERKPLFSLFTTRDRDWIGWSPMGPYEASGPGAERYLGWHQGTDNPQRPTSFALANQYRDEYQTPGGLRDLLDTGKATPPGRPKPKPRMTLWIEESEKGLPEKDAQGRLILQRRTARLKLEIQDFPRELIKTVHWQVDSGEPLEFPPPVGQEWTTDLTKWLDGKRTPHVIRAVLQSKGDDPQQYPMEIGFRYQPPAPRLTLLSANDKPVARSGVISLESNTDTFELKVEASPGVADEQGMVRLSHKYKVKAASPRKEWPLSKKMVLNHTVLLARGLNSIEIVASNVGAPANDPSESNRLIVQVVYKPDPVRLVFKELAPLPAGTRERIDLAGGGPVTVHTPRVLLKGAVDTKGKARAEWSQGKNGKPRALALAEDKSFKLTLDLSPGTQDFNFAAANAETLTLTINYAPLPPTVDLTDPDPIFDGENNGEIIVSGLLRMPADRGYKYEHTVLVGHRPAPDAQMTIDEEKGTIVLRVPLRPGIHPVQVKLSNEWKQTTFSNLVQARYLSPPRIAAFAPLTQPVKEPLLNLTAIVVSRLDLTKVDASVQKKGTAEALPISEISFKRMGEKDDRWNVALKNIALNQGLNTIRLWAVNADGRSRQPREIDVAFEKPVEPPKIEILGPLLDKSHERKYDLRVRVTSTKPLQRVDVVKGKKVYPASVNIALAIKKADELYEFTDTVKVSLESGLNEMWIVAANEGGIHRSLPVVVNFVPPPIRLEVESLTPENGPRIDLKRQANHEVVADQAPEPRLVLRGKVIWDDPADDQLKTLDRWVRVYVNGFQQRPAELQLPATGKTERTFATEILLKRETDNSIEFETPGLKSSPETLPVVHIAECARFKPNQWLHLLIIGVGEQDETKLRDGVLKAIQARGEPGNWHTDVFSRVNLYGPLISALDDLTPQEVQGQLFKIRATMSIRGEEGVNDIIMLYFKGGELIDDDGHFLLTSPRRGKGKKPDDALAFSELARFFARNQGAQLLFLDVVRDGKSVAEADQLKQWRHDADVSRVGVFRYSWLTSGKPPALPETAHLDRALQDAMPRAVRLGDVEKGLSDRIKEFVSQIPKPVKEYSYFWVYPPLKEAIINPKTP
jgi:WD40 repeat protein